jgi:hypothetical protein
MNATRPREQEPEVQGWMFAAVLSNEKPNAQRVSKQVEAWHSNFSSTNHDRK